MSTSYSNWVSCHFLLTCAFVGQFCSTMISGDVSMILLHVQYYVVNRTQEQKRKHINIHELILIKYLTPPPPSHSLDYPVSLNFKHVSVSFCQRDLFALLISNLTISPLTTLIILSFYFLQLKITWLIIFLYRPKYNRFLFICSEDLIRLKKITSNQQQILSVKSLFLMFPTIERVTIKHWNIFNKSNAHVTN